MAKEETTPSLEASVWFRDARATKMACPELEVLGPPCVVEKHVEQFLRSLLVRQGEIEGCEGTVLYAKVGESHVKLTIEKLTVERHGPLSDTDLKKGFEALAAMNDSLKKYL